MPRYLSNFSAVVNHCKKKCRSATELGTFGAHYLQYIFKVLIRWFTCSLVPTVGDNWAKVLRSVR